MKQSLNSEDWESKRWQKFQNTLSELSENNSFQKNRFPGLIKWQAWKGFDDFSNACPLTTKVDLEKDRSSNPPNGTNFTYSLKIMFAIPGRAEHPVSQPPGWTPGRIGNGCWKIGNRLWKPLE